MNTPSAPQKHGATAHARGISNSVQKLLPHFNSTPRNIEKSFPVNEGTRHCFGAPPQGAERPCDSFGFTKANTLLSRDRLRVGSQPLSHREETLDGPGHVTLVMVVVGRDVSQPSHSSPLWSVPGPEGLTVNRRVVAHAVFSRHVVSKILIQRLKRKTPESDATSCVGFLHRSRPRPGGPDH